MVLYLIGFMAAGKTTVGKLLAERLGVPFTDLDQVIEETAGISIPEIFSQEGEAGFRKRETEALYLTFAKGVISTGGGCVTTLKNREFLHDKPVVYLQTTIDEVKNRLNRVPGQRPLATGDLQMLLNEREPLYKEVAKHIVQTAGKTAETVTEEVYQWFMSI